MDISEASDKQEDKVAELDLNPVVEEEIHVVDIEECSKLTETPVNSTSESEQKVKHVDVVKDNIEKSTKTSVNLNFVPGQKEQFIDAKGVDSQLTETLINSTSESEQKVELVDVVKDSNEKSTGSSVGLNFAPEQKEQLIDAKGVNSQLAETTENSNFQQEQKVNSVDGMEKFKKLVGKKVNSNLVPELEVDVKEWSSKFAGSIPKKFTRHCFRSCEDTSLADMRTEFFNGYVIEINEALQKVCSITRMLGNTIPASVEDKIKFIDEKKSPSTIALVLLKVRFIDSVIICPKEQVNPRLIATILGQHDREAVVNHHWVTGDSSSTGSFSSIWGGAFVKFTSSDSAKLAAEHLTHQLGKLIKVISLNDWINALAKAEEMFPKKPFRSTTITISSCIFRDDFCYAKLEQKMADIGEIKRFTEVNDAGNTIIEVDWSTQVFAYVAAIVLHKARLDRLGILDVKVVVSDDGREFDAHVKKVFKKMLESDD